MSISVYWESWSSNDMTKIDPSVKIVNLAFSDPNSTYVAGQKNFNNTGMSFSQSFSAIQNQIAFLKQRGVVVMLSVGGATYPYPQNFNPASSLALMNDLGCLGIDIDWEPSDGIASANQFGMIIASIRKMSTCSISAACWSVGAYGAMQGQTYYGVNIPGLVSNGSMMSWINVMVGQGNYRPMMPGRRLIQLEHCSATGFILKAPFMWE